MTASTVEQTIWDKVNSGDWDGGASLCQEALRSDPDQPELLRPLALCLFRRGETNRAVWFLRQATIATSEDPLVWNDLGVLLYSSRDWASARDAFSSSLTKWASNFAAQLGYAASLYQLRQYAEAIPILQQCSVTEPDNRAVARLLAHCFYSEGNLPEAERWAETCLAKRRNWPELLLLLASIRHKQGKPTEVLHLTREATELCPTDETAKARLALAYWDWGDVAAAVNQSRQVGELQPGAASLYFNLSWVMLHAPDASASDLLRHHRGVIDRVVRPCVPPTAPRKTASPRSQLRIGYLSGEFFAGPAACFLTSWMKHLDHDRFRHHYYYSRPLFDHRTVEAQGNADAWREVSELSDDETAGLIQQDGIDILVDLSGHFDYNRLGVFARRAAPVQVTFPNYPSTTGLDEIDYILTDRWVSPPGSEGEYSETCSRLPSGYLMFDPGEDIPASPCPPVSSNGFVTFGIFQRPGKYHPGMWDAVAAILTEVRGSRIVIHFSSPELDDRMSGQADLLRSTLRDRRISPERVILTGNRSYSDHMGVVGSVDVALDSFPYGGQTTTCDCLWAGVPVVSLRGHSHVSRVGPSLLTRVGLGDLVAGSAGDYVRIAAELARNRGRLETLRTWLPGQARKVLGNGGQLAAEVEDAFQKFWRRASVRL